eukprot:254719_1
MNETHTKNTALYEPSQDDYKAYDWNATDGFIKALISEVKMNGHQGDLWVDGQSILRYVDDTLQKERHKRIGKPLNRAEILAIILYTGCKCNHDLSSSQRIGNYQKWKWFDLCLYKAIQKLSALEYGSFALYSGLNNVQCWTKSMKCCYFKTYVSTAWNKNVAITFKNGMILCFDKEVKNKDGVVCCDVSWISKFPEECEFLLARSIGQNVNEGFEMAVIDHISGIQTIAVQCASVKQEKESSVVERDQQTQDDHEGCTDIVFMCGTPLQ